MYHSRSDKTCNPRLYQSTDNDNVGYKSVMMIPIICLHYCMDNYSNAHYFDARLTSSKSCKKCNCITYLQAKILNEIRLLVNFFEDPHSKSLKRKKGIARARNLFHGNSSAQQKNRAGLKIAFSM